MSTKVFREGPADIIGRSFYYAILDKSIPESQEQLVGYVSVNSLDPCPEIGYSLLPESWGKGYATEALQMLLKQWWNLPRRPVDDSDEGEEKVYAICEKVNVGSSKVLRKCGFEVVSEFSFDTGVVLLWALKRP